MSSESPGTHSPTELAADAGQLDEMARRYRPALTRYFRKRASQSADVDDLIQDVFTRLAVRGNQNTILQPESYLLRTAANVWRDFLRKQRTHAHGAHDEFLDAQHSREETGPERVLQGRQSIEALLAALNELPDRTCQVFVLCRVEGMAQRLVAQRLGVSVSSIEKHMMKAIVHLTKRLSEDRGMSGL